MSYKLKLNKLFLELLLATSKKQANSLIASLTNQQANFIREIAYNLLNIKLSKAKASFIKKYQRFLKGLIRKNVNLPKVIKIIVKHKRKVLKILYYFKSELLSLAE